MQNNVPWGWSTALDFKNANRDLISSPEVVKEFIIDLCKEIKMKAYGEPWIEKFASHDNRLYGITVLQAIETSNISGHFAENVGEIYLDVFSCAPYDPQKVLDFTEKFFLCSGKIINYCKRGK